MPLNKSDIKVGDMLTFQSEDWGEDKVMTKPVAEILVGNYALLVCVTGERQGDQYLFRGGRSRQDNHLREVGYKYRDRFWMIRMKEVISAAPDTLRNKISRDLLGASAWLTQVK